MSKFSIIVPTYSGEQFIDQMFDSLLPQVKEYAAEVIVVIDGPKDTLLKIVDSYQEKFLKSDIDFSIIQFETNKGRFEARLAGAKKSKHSRLLFADDRNILDKDYLSNIIDEQYDVTIPNVIQSESYTIISNTLYLLRKAIYKSWGTDFKSYYITNENFESSSKGTTGLWIKKAIFLDMCLDLINDENHSNKYINEDTKLFKKILNYDLKIYRMSEAKVYYQSRTVFMEELRHLYERGPRFVNYYMKPGTRFFLPLLFLLLLPLLIILTFFLNESLLTMGVLAGISFLCLITVFISRSVKDFVSTIIGLPLIISVFSLGVYRGVYLNLKEKL
jgi:glycosyltransferase involved in cell wall biosynthesis